VIATRTTRLFGFLSLVVAGIVCAAAAQAGSAGAAPQGWYQSKLGWFMTERLSESGGCGARLPGNEIDTLLLLNKDDEIILAGGRPNWQIPPGQHEVSLQIDEAPPMTGSATAFGSLVMIRVQDKAMERRLLRAATLRWHFPKGDYRAAVHDIAAVVDALRACEKARRQQP
jgi:hypothetical protein